VLSLTMIIITIASRSVIQNPGVRCWNVPESLSWYRASMVTFWSSASFPAWTAASAAIMIEIFRVLADGTGTSPSRWALAPVARSFKYQLAWKPAASHISSSRFTVSRIDSLLCGSFGSGSRRTGEQRDEPADGELGLVAQHRVRVVGDRMGEEDQRVAR
jgi:hypothetical protein